MLLENLDSNHHHHLYSELPFTSPCSPHNNFSLPSPCSPHNNFSLPSPCSPHNNFSLSSPTSPHHHSAINSPPYSSTNYNYFQFPGQHYSDPTLVKEEPWSIPVHDSCSSFQSSSAYHLSARNSVSPMVLSPAISNLNTPRVSLSSHHSDFSAKLRSNHSSLQCSPHSSPLGFVDHGVGGFGHSLSVLHDLTGNNMETCNEDPGYNTPPRSGYSSPLHGMVACHSSAPPSYEQSLHNYNSTSQFPPPPYPYDQMIGSDPSLCPTNAFTPDPDSLQSEREDPPDTPDSSIKEEPSEEFSEDGTYYCRWKCCGRDCIDLKNLVDHVTNTHIEHKKGCEEYPCFWEGCSRRLKPFNAKYKLITHMRVHTGEKPHLCKQDGCTRKFARLENLKIHIRSHTGEKPFQCKFQCTKKFSNSSDRAKHEQTHKDPKPYRCEVPGCQKRYTDPSSLRKHVKNHSKEEQDQYKVCRERMLGQDQHLQWVEQEITTNLTMMGGGVGEFYPLYRNQEDFHHYRRGIERQADSLDSVEGEPSLPFDTVPIRFDSSEGGCLVSDYTQERSRLQDPFLP